MQRERRVGIFVTVQVLKPPIEVRADRRSTAHEPQKKAEFQKSFPGCTTW